MMIKVSNLRKLIQYLMAKLWVADLLCRKIPWTRSSLKSLARRSRYSEICQRGKWGRIARIQKEILLINIYLSSFGPTCRYLQILTSYQTFKFWGCSADGTRRRERVLTPLRHLRHLGQIGGAWYGSTGSGGKVTQHPHTSSAVIDKHASVFFAQMSECTYCWLSLFILKVCNRLSESVGCFVFVPPGKKLHIQFTELPKYFPDYDSSKGGKKEERKKIYIFILEQSCITPGLTCPCQLSLLLAYPYAF